MRHNGSSPTSAPSVRCAGCWPVPGDARWRVRFSELNPRRDLRTLRRFDGRLVIPGDAEWPLNLTALGADAPFCLYVRGPTNLSDGHGEVGGHRRSAGVHAVRRTRCGRARRRLCPPGDHGRVRRRVRHRRGGPPGRARRWRSDDRGSRLRCRPRLPEGTRAAHRAHRIGRSGGERGASRAIADTAGGSSNATGSSQPCRE